MDSFLSTHAPAALVSWSSSQETWSFEFKSITLSINLDTYPYSISSHSISGTPRRKDLDLIRRDIRAILSAIVPSYTSEPIFILILQCLERVAEYYPPAEDTSNSKAWDATALNSWDHILNNPYGLDASTIQDTAYAFLGKTPEEIVADIPSEWRVVHIESVLRGNHIQRFRRFQNKLQDTIVASDNLRAKLPPHSKLQNRVRAKLPTSDVIEDMLKPRVTFHGTPLRNVRSIIRHGFVMPGRRVDGKIIASPRTGIVYDRGIYSSQSPAYALSYAKGQGEMTPLGRIPSMRLFACATLMGRTYTPEYGGDDPHGPLIAGYDSHFAHSFEYIVHNEAAILPCYVIHLDLGSDEAKRSIETARRNPYYFESLMNERRQRQKLHPRLMEQNMAPGDRKREQEARKAAAMKWFPYGFGTATGTSFQVLEVGATSDDEEEYGEWQEDRHAYTTQDKDGWVHDAEIERMQTEYEPDEDGNMVPKLKKGLFMDQYQTCV